MPVSSVLSKDASVTMRGRDDVPPGFPEVLCLNPVATVYLHETPCTCTGHRGWSGRANASACPAATAACGPEGHQPTGGSPGWPFTGSAGGSSRGGRGPTSGRGSPRSAKWASSQFTAVARRVRRG